MSVVPKIVADDFYPCTLCGTAGSVIRDAPNLADKRIKCGDLRCAYVYSAKHSKDAQTAGAIPDGPATEETSSDTGTTSEGTHSEPTSSVETATVRESTAASAPKAPRSPSFVILSKDRTESEFCTNKNLKRRVIVWTAQEKKFDVFELTQRKVNATLSIQ